MFVQMFTAKVTDEDAVHDLFERWPSDFADDSDWLGCTAGVTDEGQLVALARFSSAEVARANSDRPQQDAWWRQLSANFDGEAEFFESDQVEVDLPGDPDQAGFVQVMRGKVTDAARARELMRVNPEEWADYRPDILGTMSLGQEDGRYVMAAYFTNEADARVGEKKEPPEALKAQMEEMDAINDGPVEYWDLRSPWLYSKS